MKRPDDTAEANVQLQILSEQVAQLTEQAAELCAEHALLCQPNFEDRAIAAELQWREDHPREQDRLGPPTDVT